MDRLALVDGDVIVYNSGFASDAAAKASGQEHEPLHYTLHGVNEKLDAIMRNTQSDDMRIYISHPVNEREFFFPEYKMNRDTTHKPFWYDEIKHHLFEKHGAVYSEVGDEADDALGIAQMAALAQDEETIICSIDKDLDMIPGLHYNFGPKRKANGVFDMSDPECLRLFYKQMFTGDTSDNIPGLYKRKQRKATASIMAGLDSLTTNRAMYEYVLSVYGEGEEDHLAMLGKLLYIKREPGEDGWWKPPT